MRRDPDARGIVAPAGSPEAGLAPFILAETVGIEYGNDALGQPYCHGRGGGAQSIKDRIVSREELEATLIGPEALPSMGKPATSHVRGLVPANAHRKVGGRRLQGLAVSAARPPRYRHQGDLHWADLDALGPQACARSEGSRPSSALAGLGLDRDDRY